MPAVRTRFRLAILALALGVIFLSAVGEVGARPRRARQRVDTFRAQIVRAATLAPAKKAGRNAGARLDQPIGVQPNRPRPTSRQGPVSLSYFVIHANRVKRDLLLFAPSFIGQTPSIAVTAVEPTNGRAFSFVTRLGAQDSLEQARAFDRGLLLRDPRSLGGGGIAYGFGLFAATVFTAAHAPPPLRLLFDGPLHLGPAIFNGGGMGAGIGGRAP